MESASGKFTITARLESVDGTEAKLVTQDGRHISVAIEKLSAEDQKHIKESKREPENPFKVETRPVSRVSSRTPRTVRFG